MAALPATFMALAWLLAFIGLVMQIFERPY